MSKVFSDLLNGFEEFANLTNNEKLLNHIKSIKEHDLNESSNINETMNKRYFKVVEKVGDGNYYTAYFINAEYPSDAEEIAKKHAERYGNEIFGIELTTELEVENGKKRGMSVIEESADGPDMSQLRSNIMEFPNGEYFYIEYKDGELIAGSATNNGILREFSADYDDDLSLDVNIQNFYDRIVEDRPELLNTNEGCTSNKCDYTDDGKDDIVKKYEILSDGRFMEYVTGTEEMVLDRIKDYESADESDRHMFEINGLEMPVYTYKVVNESDTESLKFDVDENFRIRESNRNI